MKYRLRIYNNAEQKARMQLVDRTNRLLRQHLPQGTDLSLRSQMRLNAIAGQLNEQPRKTLEFETPAERFKACVASTG